MASEITGPTVRHEEGGHATVPEQNVEDDQGAALPVPNLSPLNIPTLGQDNLPHQENNNGIDQGG